MPLTEKGEKIMANMKQTYKDPDKAKEVFYASANKGTIQGVHHDNMDVTNVPNQLPPVAAGTPGADIKPFNTGLPPSGQVPPMALPAKEKAIQPPTLATTPLPQPEATKGKAGAMPVVAPAPAPLRDSGGFTLPNTVSHSEIKNQSKRYGGW